jgi:hypothetical protein
VKWIANWWESHGFAVDPQFKPQVHPTPFEYEDEDEKILAKTQDSQPQQGKDNRRGPFL